MEPPSSVIPVQITTVLTSLVTSNVYNELTALQWMAAYKQPDLDSIGYLKKEREHKAGEMRRIWEEFGGGLEVTMIEMHCIRV